MGNEKQDKAIYAITRDVARQQREIETLKYKVAILERDKHEGTSMTQSVEVREMTVTEMAQIINQEDCWDGAVEAALALAKLGTIRIAGDV